MKGLCIILRTFMCVTTVELLKNMCYQNLICVPIVDNEEATFGSRPTMQPEHEQKQVLFTPSKSYLLYVMEYNIIDIIKPWIRRPV